MRVICDVEADSLTPTRIWVIVCKDIDNGTLHVFRRPDLLPKPFLDFADKVVQWVGHNFLGFDIDAINNLVGNCISPENVVDTLVCSKVFNFKVEGGHSLGSWGKRLGKHKLEFNEFEPYDDAEREADRLARCETYCIGDVELNLDLFKLFEPHINKETWQRALRTEHAMVRITKRMHEDGFAFNLVRVEQIRREILQRIDELFNTLQTSFHPLPEFVSVVHPKATKRGTISRNEFRWADTNDLSAYSVDAPFSRITWREFNPGSPQQVVERLNLLGWQPHEKTKGHVECERALRHLRGQALRDAKERLEEYRKTGWKISEENLDTLPDDAPEAARHLIEWRFLEKRRQTIEEWINAYNDHTGRIHGNFNHIGTWTHRMAHDNPNMGNVPSTASKYHSPVLKRLASTYGKDLRSCWTVPRGRRLVGVDADSIQLRILAHYMGDEEFTRALVSGSKDDGTDPHTLNKNKLGIEGITRDNAKTFIYAWILGAGFAKVAKILGCSISEAERAVNNFIAGYPGLQYLREELIPRDKRNGYFTAIDGRLIKFDKEWHFGQVLGGYLQSGEAIVMKEATILWQKELTQSEIDYILVNFVHDEWQTETPDVDKVAEFVAASQCDAIRRAGLSLGSNCPLLGTAKRVNFNGIEQVGGYNWYDTH